MLEARPTTPPPRGRIAIAFVVTIAAALIEIEGSRLGHTLFLVADALHLVAHVAIFAVLLVPAHTHNHEERRTRIVLGIVIMTALGIGLEAVHHWVEPHARPIPAAMLLSLVGLGANVTVAMLFRVAAREQLSFRAALVHEASDGTLTLVALGAAAAIAWLRWYWLDPALSLMVAVWLLVWSVRWIVRPVPSQP